MPAKVVVVDDTEGNRYAVSHLLKSIGLRVLEGENGTQALELLDEAPDLVILDINLPDMSGYEVLRRIRSNPETSWIPVMHVTASYTGSANHALGLDLGADAYLTHPLDPQIFLATTRALLRLSQAEGRVRRASQEWRAAFDSLNDSVFVIGSSQGTKGRDRVQRCNRPAADLMGKEPREVIGMLWSEVLESLGASESPVLSPGKPGSAAHPKADVALRDRWFNVSMEHSRRIGEDQGFCVCVLRDITDRVKGEKEKEELMQRANLAQLEAESANQAKGEFLAVMSHELRTPLNAIGGYVDLLAMGIRGPLTEEQTTDLARIKRSQSSLTVLINDLLNFAKAESGELEYHMSEFPVRDALDRAAEVVEHQLEHRGLSFVRVDAALDVIVKGDADKIQQIVLNLLSNAIKFTPSGGTITLESREKDDEVEVSVSDTGGGIPEDMIEAIFEPFVQVHPGRIKETGGVGLGLAISRDLARGMGAELRVGGSSSLGTEFLLSLKRA
jgi:signal transduction histidine kinase/CheY-like chemotaxis protein